MAELLPDYKGKLVGFHGKLVHHMRRRPGGTEYWEEQLQCDLLPKVAILAGFELVRLYPPDFGRDPYVLYDRYGEILHVWREGYTPRWFEVYEVCRQFL